MDMKNVEIVYRYGSGDAVIRPRPADAGEARRRLDEGNRAFAALLDNVGEEGPAARRVVSWPRRPFG